MKNNKMTCGIYKITERETGRCYIGQSKQIEERWKRHKGKGGKFPVSAFDYEIIRETNNVNFLNAFEKYYIKFYDSHKNGFNRTIGGTDIKSTHHDAETRRNISKALAGKPFSEERKQNISKAMTGKPPHNKGKKTGPASEETRRKQSEAHFGKSHSEEHKQNISEGKTGKPLSKSQCPHCCGWFDGGNMAKYHGDKCKKKEINNEHDF